MAVGKDVCCNTPYQEKAGSFRGFVPSSSLLSGPGADGLRFLAVLSSNHLRKMLQATRALLMKIAPDDEAHEVQVQTAPKDDRCLVCVLGKPAPQAIVPPAPLPVERRGLRLCSPKSPKAIKGS